jgi:hypothetical protein
MGARENAVPYPLDNIDSEPLRLSPLNSKLLQQVVYHYCAVKCGTQTRLCRVVEPGQLAEARGNVAQLVRALA